MLNGRRIAGAAAAVVVITVISKILGFGREAALAAVFGASGATDAYLVAMIIPSLLFGVVGTTITTVGIPLFAEYIHDPARRRELAGLLWSTFHGIVVFLGLVVLVAWLLTPWLVRLMAPGFEGEQAQLTVLLVRVLLPAAVFMGLAGWAQGVLNAHQRFTAPAAMGIPYNVIIIAAILLSGRWWGIEGVAVATLLGIAAQFLIQLPTFRRLGLSYRPLFDLGHPGLRRMLLLAGPVIIGVGANQLNVIVDRMLASGLAEGSISALNYAQKALGLPVGLFALPLVTVLYSSLSRHNVVGDAAAFRETLARGLSVLGFLMIPMTVGLIVLRADFVRFLFQRGAFDDADAAMTGTAVLFYSLGILFIVWWDYLNRTFYALQDTATPMWTGLAAVAVNIGLNLALVRVMGLGGLALASSAAALVGFGLILWRLRRRLGRIGGRRLAIETGKVCLAAGLMGLAVWRANEALAAGAWGLLAEQLVQALGGGALGDFAAAGVKLIGLIAFGGLVYTVLCRLLRVREMALVWELGRSVLGRLAGANRQAG
ncbi:murein biosynthesis integral membrane protein MurJ [Candidatus Desulforudis audaxviator]|nr:murein biosynthesis integral membrane protein MurJ [Candidatus Desulforudis audaxviator]AZK60223.1 integral membrane protein MviN [Candidatus Desulforudis audaxviator]